MKTMLHTGLISLFIIVCSISTVFAPPPQKTVPEALSPLWLAVPVAGMFVYRFIRARNRS